MQTVFAIALGGAIGSVLRHFLNNFVTGIAHSSFPYGIMAVNVLGGFIMGGLVAGFADAGPSSQTMRTFLMVGIMGGFTTFSAFSADTVLLWQRGETMQATIYVFGSVLLSVAALMAGMIIVRAVNG